MKKRTVLGLALVLTVASGILACSSGPALVASPDSDAPSVTPSGSAPMTVGPQGTAHRELPPLVDFTLRGLITESDQRLSHERRLAAVEPWGNRTGSKPFRLVRPARTDIERARRTRRDRRSFDGAPPVMGHSLQFGGEHSCLECHSLGMRIGDRVARPMSHAELPNCTQCHIEGKNEWLDESTLPANDFVGWWNSAKSERAAEGAPPTIPHDTFLRTSCLSCHGQFGYEGLRTNHPERANCLQCHVMRK